MFGQEHVKNTLIFARCLGSSPVNAQLETVETKKGKIEYRKFNTLKSSQ